MASGFGLVPVPPPPAQWPLHLDRARPPPPTVDSSTEASKRSGHGTTTDDVTIPVWGDPPNGTTSGVATTVDVDWSDDRFVRFHADRAGLYYVPASWHPNWTLTSDGAGPWPAGPNQMVVMADTAGLAEMMWGKHWSESVGQAVSAVTPFLVIATSVLVLRIRRRRPSGTDVFP